MNTVPSLPLLKELVAQLAGISRQPGDTSASYWKNKIFATLDTLYTENARLKDKLEYNSSYIESQNESFDIIMQANIQMKAKLDAASKHECAYLCGIQMK